MGMFFLNQISVNKCGINAMCIFGYRLFIKIFSMAEIAQIPKDIILKLKQDFKNDNEYDEALKLILHIRQENLNVGWVQLSRSIILIADGNIRKLKQIIESGYYGDPRDVIMEMMQIPGNTNDHGLTPFEG